MKAAIHPNPAPVLARLVAGLLAALMAGSPAYGQSGGDSAPSKTKASASATHKATAKKAAKSNKKTKKTGRRIRRRPSARTQRIRRAFVASSELRPMAQQLATLRTLAAYAGVTGYARQHTGDAAAAAYLALGHAYLLDKRYQEAVASLHQAHETSDVLDDYADFLGAQANHESGNEAAAEALLRGFAQRYPDSIFVAQAPELEANILLAMSDAAGAQKVLAAAATGPAAERSGYQLARGQVALALGQKEQAVGIFKQVLLTHPLSHDAEVARAQLTAQGAESTLTVAELRSLGDAFYRAHRYSEASEQYHALARRADLPVDSRNSFAVAAAACDLKLKRLSKAEAEALPDTQDDNGARRLYLLMELARNRGDEAEQQSIVTRMEASFPRSEWLAEALFSSGNMNLLQRDYPKAVEYYSYLAMHFPDSRYAPAAHWRAGWLSYRQDLYADASRLFDEQIRLYPAATETVAALYWRARLYETQDHKPAMAAANYRAIIRAYQHFFYAQMARQRLAALGDVQPAAEPALDRFKAPAVPPLEDSFPDDNEHLAKARVLANAGLNEYVAQEIAADPDSASWSALAEAQIFASYGEDFRAMRALKRALPYAATASINAIPLVYWRILFPEPYWETIKAESARNNLNPYLVASLIRQESEFNPSVISYANAYGLMQLLPSVGRAMAREEGVSHFQTFQLLNPETNIRLGTRYLRQMLDKFGGVPEYALAAYNAGDNRVEDWQAAGPYQGMDEFVESIPFTQTREYVQAILRNIETYQAIDAAARTETATASGGRESTEGSH
ncbi:MAG: transglycosylase SLT domain-containing protein [Acidobacteriota bacterium]|nr:transglycosylase SLT domain-containing protein [Acidobacteriota bacterium]